jgi:hypothetical protein
MPPQKLNLGATANKPMGAVEDAFRRIRVWPWWEPPGGSPEVNQTTELEAASEDCRHADPLSRSP